MQFESIEPTLTQEIVHLDPQPWIHAQTPHLKPPRTLYPRNQQPNQQLTNQPTHVQLGAEKRRVDAELSQLRAELGGRMDTSDDLFVKVRSNTTSTPCTHFGYLCLSYELRVWGALHHLHTM